MDFDKNSKKGPLEKKTHFYSVCLYNTVISFNKWVFVIHIFHHQEHSYMIMQNSTSALFLNLSLSVQQFKQRSIWGSDSLTSHDVHSCFDSPLGQNISIPNLVIPSLSSLHSLLSFFVWQWFRGRSNTLLRLEGGRGNLNSVKIKSVRRGGRGSPKCNVTL